MYGLSDASRGFHLSLSRQHQGSGCERSLLDPEMFLLFQQGTNKDEEDKDFEEKVIIPLKKIFKFGSDEEECFKYVGINMVQVDDHIRVD